MYFYCCLMVFLDQAKEKIQVCRENWLLPVTRKKHQTQRRAQQQKYMGQKSTHRGEMGEETG